MTRHGVRDGVQYERLHNGALSLYASDSDGFLVTRTYYDYTLEEAVEMFKADLT